MSYPYSSAYRLSIVSFLFSGDVRHSVWVAWRALLLLTFVSLMRATQVQAGHILSHVPYGLVARWHIRFFGTVSIARCLVARGDVPA